MVDLRYHGSVADVQGLFDPGAARSPFDRPAWFALLEETGDRPLVALARDGAASAAMVLRARAGRLEAFTNWYSFTWRPLANATAEAQESLLEAIAADLARRAHRVTLAPLPDEDGCASLLAQAFRKAGWRVEMTPCDTNHILPIQNRSFAQYWARRPGPLRTTLARKARKLELRIVDRFEPELWSQYERIYEQSWKPSEGEPAMLRAFAQAQGEEGRLRLGLAYHQGEAIAAQFWTFERGTAFIHKLAHLESHRQLSAGTCLSAALFEHAIDQDRAELVDFGTGDERYKADWMEETRPRFRLDCLDLENPRAWPALARKLASRSRR